jgi:excinuclease UvrABC nuclease subunit
MEPDACQTVALDALESAPNAPAVFRILTRDGEPYLGRTGLLRRRLVRLLREREQPSRMLNLRAVATQVDYWLTGSRLDASLRYYQLARRHFPGTYPQLVKLRWPTYVKLVLGNEFPRTMLTTRLSGGAGLYYGPFRTRAAAETFEGEFLDLFQLRRCEENLAPHADHPGCIYGEMNRCLRPCQLIVTREQYAQETSRVEQFLRTNGQSMLESVAAARERFSHELDFENAARQHQRHERIGKILGLRDELVTELDQLQGVAVTASARPDEVQLTWWRRGWWHGPVVFPLQAAGAEIVSLDRRLRDLAAQLPPADGTWVQRQEHVALLARWFYSSWRDGEWIPFASYAQVPYRKLTNAIHRVATRPMAGK